MGQTPSQEQQQEEENPTEFVQQQVYQQRENFELLQVISQVLGIFCNEVERYLVIISNNQPLAFTQQFKNYQLHNKHETQELIERKMTLNLEELHTLVQQYNAETNRSLDLLQLVQKKDFIEWINAIHQNYNCKNSPYLQILLDLKNGNQNWIKTLIQSSQYSQQQENQTQFISTFEKRPENDKIKAINQLVENGCKANQIAKDWQKKQTKESPVLEMDGNKQKNTDLMKQNFV